MITEECQSNSLLQAGTATFSDDRRCRFRLQRIWESAGRSLLFIMLNPSIAGADVDDPTVRKCMRYAKRWGYGSLTVVNVYPCIATDPTKLDRELEFRTNLEVIRQEAEMAERIVCAWGKHAKYVHVREVVSCLPGTKLYALRRNKDGSPCHPLYLADAIEPVVYA